MSAPPPPPVAVIFDLDGLLLDTESLCVSVAASVLAAHGKQLTAAAHRAALGKRPLDCWEAVRGELGIQASAQELVDASEPLLEAQ